MLSNCVTCQVPLRVDYPQRRPESADSEKKSEMVICEMLSGQSRNLMKLLTDASVPPDAPVCNDCSTALQKEMDEQTAYLDDEIKTYKSYLEHLKENHPSAQMAELRAYEQNVDDEIAALEKELKQLSVEEEKLDAELAQRRKAAEMSSEQSAELWTTYRDNLRRVFEDQDELLSLEAERQYAEVQHRKLIDTSIMDMSFHIWVDANFGEINGFRLAYVKETQPVEYTEINAALGQCVLLLEILLERIGVQHHELVPVPMGSHSYIKLRRNGNDIETYPMYGQGTPLSGTCAIDAGIRRFLQLLEFLQKELKDRNKNFKPPYQIHTDGIVDNAIKYNVTMTLNTETRWTRAMCLMLTNLKAAVAQCDALRNPMN